MTKVFLVLRARPVLLDLLASLASMPLMVRRVIRERPVILAPLDPLVKMVTLARSVLMEN